jgi:hypothetical protein
MDASIAKIYWTTVYNHGDKTDHIIELEQIEPFGSSWRVTLDDNEFTMTSATPSSDFWGLVQEALVLIEPGERTV